MSSLRPALFALCTHCHRDSSFNAVYDNSTHGKKGVDCFACHVDKSLFSNLTDKMVGLATFSFGKIHLGAFVKDENCLRCHQAVSRFNYVAKEALPEKLKDIGMTIGHKRHIDLRDSCRTCHAAKTLPQNQAFKFIQQKDPMGCAACHNRIAHARPTKYDITYPTEEQCGYCHGKNRKCPSLKAISDVKDKGRCTECHPNQYSL